MNMCPLWMHCLKLGSKHSDKHYIYANSSNDKLKTFWLFVVLGPFIPATVRNTP